MTNKKSENYKDDGELFRQTFADVSPIEQDKIPLKPSQSKQKSALKHQNNEFKQAVASFHFSDVFEAHFPSDGPLKYVKPGTDSYEVKKLRRGEYSPELILDLHGMKKNDAKLEIAALIQAAQKQHIDCVCIVHGIGGYILKKAVPNWLAQHPAVLGFHQASLEWGGNGALLVLIEPNISIGHGYKP